MFFQGLSDFFSITFVNERNISSGIYDSH